MMNNGKKKDEAELFEVSTLRGSDTICHDSNMTVWNESWGKFTEKEEGTLCRFEYIEQEQVNLQEKIALT